MRSRWLFVVTLTLLTATILGTGAASAFAAAPANDVFATVAAGPALTPAASGSVAGTNVGATLDPGEVPPAGNTASIWYKWTAPADDIVSFDTIGSVDPTVPEPLPTDLRAYTGSAVGSLAEVPESFLPGDLNPLGHVEFPATGGRTYYVAITSPENAAKGNTVLNWHTKGNTGHITGTVTSSNGVTALPGIRVDAYRVGGSGNSLRTVTTNAAGGYDLTGLGTAAYKVRFSDPSVMHTYLPEWYDDKLTEEAAVSVGVTNGSATALNNVRLDKASSISGTVRINGSVTEAVAVLLLEYTGGVISGSMQAETNASGGYSFTGLYPKVGTGNYYVVQFIEPFGSGLATQFYNQKTALALADKLQPVEGTAIGSINGSWPIGNAPPAAPGNFAAVAAGVDKVNLSWAVPAGASQVKIFRSTAGFATSYDGITNPPGQTPVPVGAGTTYQDTGLTAGTRYFYTAFAGDTSNNWSGPATADATTTLNTYTITPSAGPNGSISPSTVQTLNSGASMTFTITAAPGHHIADVLVDGVSKGAIATHTFTNVTANHTISASFAATAPGTYTITPSAGVHGSISPNTVQVVDSGGSSTFTIAADSGYHIQDVMKDGASIGASSSVTFSNVTSDHTLNATFAADVAATYTITPSAGANGSISPSTVQTVTAGASMTFIITPDPGYHIADVLVDGISKGAIASHTFTNVTANHTISASFAVTAPGTYTITPSAGVHGSISPNTVQIVDSGGSSTFTIAADSGYHIQDVKKDGASIGASSSVTFTNVTANHTISATFAANAPTVTLTPVYRFLNNKMGTHFYTASEAEYQDVLDNKKADFTYEGKAYKVAPTATAGAIPVYRFLSKKLPYVHFYTATEAEMTNVKNTMTADWGYEGVAYYVWPAKTGTLTPVWRFFKPKLAVHFYTATESEMTNVKNTMTADYTYEGVAYYVEPYVAP